MSAAAGTTAEIVSGSCHHDCPDTCGWHVTVDRTRADTGGDADARQPRSPVQQGRAVPEGEQVPRSRVQRRAGAASAAPRRAEGRGPVRADHVGRGARPRSHRASTRSSTATAPRRSCRTATPATRACWRWASPSGSGIGLGATRVERSICGPTVGAGVKMTNGTTKCLDPLEIRHSKLIILWGTNTKLTNRHLWPTIEAGPRRRRQSRRARPHPHHDRRSRPTGSSNRGPAPTSR